jgi:hypothetical protein
MYLRLPVGLLTGKPANPATGRPGEAIPPDSPSREIKAQAQRRIVGACECGNDPQEFDDDGAGY